ncbi:cupin domain-containing protein [Peribacillus phoenicis]|uniref:cupin domain-containing protein n=1 Tax=unclassified Peribacillus TaxID=2675266 RepID=UPI0039A2D4F4
MNFPYEKLIFKNENSPLSSIPFHKDVQCIERFFSNEFPFHLAIHKVTNANGLDEDYTIPHVHNEEDEINIIVGEECGLEYRIQLGEKEFVVSSNSTIWIPAGVKHSANVLKGNGYFIAIRMEPTRFDKEYMRKQFELNLV